MNTQTAQDAQPGPISDYIDPPTILERRRLTFARYLYETGRIREGYGCAQS
jgi:hypothetical protein